MKRPKNPNKGLDYIHYANGEQLCAEREWDAGADAIVKALKGISYENSMSIPKLSGFIHSQVVGKKGKIVFIEEEE